MSTPERKETSTLKTRITLLKETIAKEREDLRNGDMKTFFQVVRNFLE
jgi:hypothetical protein